MGILEKLIPAAKPLRFAEKMLAQILKQQPELQLEINEREFCLESRNTTTTRFYLHNAYHEYCRASVFQRKKIIVAFGSLGSQMQPSVTELTVEEAKTKLLPRVRERWYHESMKLVLSQSGDSLSITTRRLNDELTLELVIDLPDAVAIVTDKHLYDWKLSFDEALIIAKDNLWRISVKDFVEIEPGVFMSPFNDTHDASRMLLSDLVWQLPVKGRVVAAVPNRNFLVVTGSEDVAGLSFVAKLVERSLSEPRPMTGHLFVLQEGTWSSFLPDRLSPVYELALRIRLLSDRMQYDEQGELLLKRQEAEGKDVYVASFVVIELADGRHFSWTSCVGTVTEALLPKSQVVAVGRHEKDGPYWVDWKDFAEAAGDSLKQTEDFPPRYHLQGLDVNRLLSVVNARQSPLPDA
jgi:hypothetical protein